MANALIYGGSGTGKTVNTTLLPGDNLLISSDNSHIVLNNFDRPNLTIKPIFTISDFIEAYKKGYEKRNHPHIIIDNITDIFDLWIMECTDSGKFKDPRQSYQFVYQSLKRLARDSAEANVHTVFTAWSDTIPYTDQSGETLIRIQPNLPSKILDNFCGLMNVIGLVESREVNGERIWRYITEGTTQRMAKDQIGIRKIIKPEELFIGV